MGGGASRTVRQEAGLANKGLDLTRRSASGAGSLGLYLAALREQLGRAGETRDVRQLLLPLGVPMGPHTTGRFQRLAALLALALSLPSAAVAQHSSAPFIPSAPPPPELTVTAGVGNAMGWFGGQAERYLRAGRVGLFAGLGYLPALNNGDPSGPTFAAGVRTYTNGQKHRAFLEASISQIAAERGPCYGDCLRAYGPGIQLG